MLLVPLSPRSQNLRNLACAIASYVLASSFFWNCQGVMAAEMLQDAAPSQASGTQKLQSLKNADLGTFNTTNEPTIHGKLPPFSLKLEKGTPPPKSKPSIFSTPESNQLDYLGDEILLKEIELFKINTFFRAENGKDRPGKRWRTMLYKLANYTCTFGGMVVNMSYNFTYWTHPSLTPVAVQLSATVPRLVGKAILIAGNLYEAALESRDRNNEKKQGYDRATEAKRVGEIKGEIDTLLSRRQELLDRSITLNKAYKQAYADETAVLAAGEELALSEFVELHANSTAKSTENRLTNTLTVIKKADGAFGSDVTRVVAAATRNGNLNPIASMSTGISGSMALMNPIVEIAARKVAHAVSKKKMEKQLSLPKENFPASFANAEEHFQRSLTELKVDDAGGASGTFAARTGLFAQELKAYKDMDFINTSFEKQQKRHDVHSVFIHMISGGTKLARGFALVYVGFHYVGNTNRGNTGTAMLLNAELKHLTPQQRQLVYVNLPGHGGAVTDSQRNSYLTGIFAIPYVVGTGIRLLDLLRTMTIEVKNRKQLAAKRSVYGTILTGRLDSLDEMEDQLHTNMLASRRK